MFESHAAVCEFCGKPIWRKVPGSDDKYEQIHTEELHG